MAYNPYAAGANMPQIPQPNGWAGKMAGMAGNNQNMLLQLGMGLLDKRQNNAMPFSAIGQQAMAGQQMDQETKNRNMTKEWLMRVKGLSEQDAQAAMANPVVLSEIMKEPKEPKGPISVGQNETLLDPDTYQPIYQGQSEQPNSYQEFELARDDPAYASHLQGQQGGRGTDDMRELAQINAERQAKGEPPLSLLDYQMGRSRAGAGGTRLPSGWQPKDELNPRAGIEPMPGGPGTQIPGELAARVGMADSFLGQAPQIREQISGGAATGPLDRFQAGWNDQSQQAQIRRQIKSGTDALQRMLTGAGMPMAEAADYAGRYLPSYTDDAESAANKVDQLVREIQMIKSIVLRGRGQMDEGPPEGVDPQDWEFMSPEDKALFQ